MSELLRDAIGEAERACRASLEGPHPILEVYERVRNATTGGEKGQKLARFDLVPARPLWELAEHYGKGAKKYEERNWERGYDWSLSYQAVMRHLLKFWQGEDTEIDPETGVECSHLAAAAFHVFALMEYCHTHRELDNRPGGRRDGASNVSPGPAAPRSRDVQELSQEELRPGAAPEA